MVEFRSMGERMSRHFFGGRKKDPSLPHPAVPLLSDPAFPEIAPWVWWLLGAVGLGIRLAFILRGNIAFNSDEARAALWLRQWCGKGLNGISLSSMDFAGLRLAGGWLFYVLTDGWVYFISLASIFFNCFFSAVWVYWVHLRISRVAALGTALLFAFPPVCIAYYSTHLERRIETLFWASLLVAFSGAWFKKNWTALLLGALVGWAFWNEPFILFFALPVVAYEIRCCQESGSMGKRLAWTAAGLSLGGTSGRLWNAGFSDVFWSMDLASRQGIGKNLGLLWNAFPQFWNGNFPFGYLQASSLGRWMDPVQGGMFAAFLAFWAFASFGLAAGGCVMLAREKNMEGAWLSALVHAPALLYLLFFVFSAQVWDATSFRYLDYWVIFTAVGGGGAFYYLFQWRRRTAVLAAALFVLVQGFILAEKYRQLPADFPAVRIVRNLELLGFRQCLANHWVAEAGTYLSDGKVFIAEYKSAGNIRAWGRMLAGERIGLVVLKGLDDNSEVEKTVRSLDANGFRCAKTWPMMGGWFVLDFQRKAGKL